MTSLNSSKRVDKTVNSTEFNVEIESEIQTQNVQQMSSESIREETTHIEEVNDKESTTVSDTSTQQFFEPSSSLLVSGYGDSFDELLHTSEVRRTFIINKWPNPKLICTLLLE